jgi:hypothetical protein
VTVLHTIHDVKRLEGSRRLPEPYMDYVSQFFIDLYAQYGDGHDLLGFSLDGIAEIVILDDDDNVNGLYLPTVPDRLDLINMEPDWVERIDLPGSLSVFKLAFMPDNERMVFVFSEVGNLDDATEEWLAEQLEWSEFFTSRLNRD